MKTDQFRHNLHDNQFKFLYILRDLNQHWLSIKKIEPVHWTKIASLQEQQIQNPMDAAQGLGTPTVDGVQQGLFCTPWGRQYCI